MAYQLLWNGGDAPDADIWFVHGLRGNLIDTWSSGKVCWPRDLLKVDTPTCRIFTWGYDVNVANVTHAASHATIFGHAESLLQDICMSRASKGEAERPLVFVGHSLGGLVIKEALIRSSEYFFNRQDEELGSVYACTKGIVFLGTPHRGSELTSYGHVVAKVAKVFLRNPNEHLISLLEKESPILERQRRSFASISKNLDIACVIEELPTSLGIVVPESSATIDGFNVKYQQIPRNHMDMCKFATQDELGYKRVVFLLCNIIKRTLGKSCSQARPSAGQHLAAGPTPGLRAPQASLAPAPETPSEETRHQYDKV
ncbi:ribonuclease p/mrp subunit [Sporothrix schenckii 1099-18]|uniref:Ribonuclease p/mrp subunit n=1 Tax=Sporothrix schenckii 1099-18 TaxID=1397361 RepID=A0A0F2MJE5_SPOSC|nr:ribonuclease p/mrp subunit [Sporothrix schenckii 1099-18]KJR89828.1 ribonuclease p/mrp subunit [Sporothrix schenckii 1099-18]